jgi:hypothetical protein
MPLVAPVMTMTCSLTGFSLTRMTAPLRDGLPRAAIGVPLSHHQSGNHGDTGDTEE